MRLFDQLPKELREAHANSVIDWAVIGEMTAVRRLGLARGLQMHWEQDDAARREWRREIETLARLPGSALKASKVAPVVPAVAPKQGCLL
jgi:hypothetical protein